MSLAAIFRFMNSCFCTFLNMAMSQFGEKLLAETHRSKINDSQEILHICRNVDNWKSQVTVEEEEASS